MNESKVFWSVQVIGVCLSLMAFAIGCSNTQHQRQEAVANSFSNQTVQVKATTYTDQFIVRCEDGSIWEVKAAPESGTYNIPITYKNCLFDALYRLPEKPVIPPLPPLSPLPLEKNDTTNRVGIIIPNSPSSFLLAEICKNNGIQSQIQIFQDSDSSLMWPNPSLAR